MRRRINGLRRRAQSVQALVAADHVVIEIVSTSRRSTRAEELRRCTTS